MISVSTAIRTGQTALGIEFGSTRIKLVLLDAADNPVAQGAYTWESRWENGHWTYSMEETVLGMQTAYAQLASEVFTRYGSRLESIGCIGISAMMHGYLAFDAQGRLLVPFRTWRDTTTAEAAAELTKAFGFNIPQRWSVAHLRQAILNGEPHIAQLASINTLAGTVHGWLTGRRVLGIGDASGMFPVDMTSGTYHADMLARWETLPIPAGAARPAFPLAQLLPEPLPAGAEAGTLTPQGAQLLDPTGTLQPGIPFCPPEGDAGTGMVATDSVAPRTGNVSAGTSIFAMVVLEHPLRAVYPEIDIVATPDGAPVAMVHCNNCTGDLDAWIRLFGEVLSTMGVNADPSLLYDRLYRQALFAEPDCPGYTPVNYCAGEGVTHFDAGVPLLMRDFSVPGSLADFMRASLYSLLATLRMGLDVLAPENIRLDRLCGHGGIFKTRGVAQRFLAAAMRTPVSVLQTAGEGGPYGMALLAAYRRERAAGLTETLPAFLTRAVFASAPVSTLAPQPEEIEGFERFLARYRKALAVERSAVAQFPATAP